MLTKGKGGEAAHINIARRSGRSTLPIVVAMAHFPRTELPGGVVEWFMAPVLKTGKAQAFVSSNLTPSAFSIFDCRFSIFDLSKKEARNQNGRKHSKCGRAHYIG
jgi:hypothetical protein